MNADVKREWIKRLRSGFYKQGKEHLRYDDEYCCLGILCEIAAEKGVISPPTLGQFGYKYDEESAYASHKVEQWAGLFTSQSRQLAEMNDDGFPFDSIANFIENNL
jgi:hypothetical protein